MAKAYLQYKNLKIREDIQLGTPEDDEYTEAMKAYREYLTLEVCENDEFLYAFEIFEDNFKKEIVEALFLADAEPVDISISFDMSATTLETYRELFFDTENTFRSSLDKVCYIEDYENTFGKDLKLRAYSLGPQFIYFKYGNVVPKTEEQRVLVKKMFLASAYRAMEANFNPLNSRVTKHAMEWSKTMIKTYEVMEKLMGDDTDHGNDLLTIITKKGLGADQVDPTTEEIV